MRDPLYFHRPTPTPHTLNFRKLHIDVYYITSRRSTSPPAHLLSYRGMNMRKRQSLRRTYIGRYPAPPFTEMDRTDLLEWNYHIIYWFTMSL